jgi:hypothetical protein
LSCTKSNQISLIWIFAGLSATAAALSIQCSTGTERIDTNGIGSIPFMELLLDGNNCDYFQNTSGDCQNINLTVIPPCESDWRQQPSSSLAQKRQTRSVTFYEGGETFVDGA